MAKRISGLDMTPEQFREFGRCTPAEIKSVFDPASDIASQLVEAAQRQRDARSAAADRCPPLANRGGKSSDGSDDLITLVLDDGKVKEIPKRRGYGSNAAIVDWLNFTIGVETFVDDDDAIDNESCSFLTMPDVPKAIVCLSRCLKKMIGYGISHKLAYGQNFYDSSYVLAENWGTVSIGGQKDTVLVSISGTGLAAAKPGWELAVMRFLESAARARITRIDLAYDDYTGESYSVDKADQDHTDGLFKRGGRNPKCECRGDWKNPDGSGRSFYVGSRKNGKYCRVYEKGRELGSKTSEWVRVEVEFKSVEYVLPFDMLIKAGEYLAASYPAFGWISERQERILTTQRTVNANVDRAIATVKHQFGNTVRALVEFFGLEKTFDLISRNDKEPRFTQIPHYGLAGKAIHESDTTGSAILCAA